MGRDVGKSFVPDAVKAKLRVIKAWRVWSRCVDHAPYSMARTDRAEEAFRKAEFDNERYNMLCGPRYALLACRIANRLLKSRRKYNEGRTHEEVPG